MERKFLKITTIIALLLCSCIAFNSCEKESPYNPEQKIKKIYSWNELRQEWTWDDDKLTSIFYYDKNFITNIESYIYDKNRLLKKIEDKYGYYQISYSNSRYKKIEYFDKESVLMGIWDFSYRNNKVYQIKFMYSNDYLIDKITKGGFISSLIAKEFISLIEHSPKGAKESYVTFTYKYEGDNIAQLKLEFEGTENSATLVYKSYDIMQNPFYRQIDLDNSIYNPHLYTLFLTSKNNPLELELYENESLFIIHYYSYVYDNELPIEVENRFDWEGHQSISKISYEYYK